MRAKRSTTQAPATDFEVIMAELNRRFASQTGKYQLCPNRLCRRLRRCADADMPCAGHAMRRPISRTDEWHVKGGIKRGRKRG